MTAPFVVSTEKAAQPSFERRNSCGDDLFETRFQPVEKNLADLIVSKIKNIALIQEVIQNFR
jgi:hypothetical protein